MANSDNPRKGAAFELAVSNFPAEQGIRVVRNFAVELGATSLKRSHKFDFGGHDPKVIIECKCHSWTEGKNSPSAKMSLWNEAMYYFSLAPNDYRKILFVLLSRLDAQRETLLAYYLRRFEHLIPCGVEIWEFDAETRSAVCCYPRKQFSKSNCEASLTENRIR